MKAGDILLIDDYAGQGDLVGNLIFDGEKSRYGVAEWTHSALAISSTEIVEALAEGVARSPVLKYDRVKTKVISPDVDPAMRAYAVRYAIGQIGDAYGYLDFVALAVLLATGINVLPHQDRTPICSELVSRATECYTDHGYQYGPELMMPQDLDVAWGAAHGQPLPYYRRWLLLAQTLYWWAAPWKHGLKKNA